MSRTRKLTMTPTTTLTIEESFNKFIKYCTVKNLSARTIKLYESHYRMFYGFVNPYDSISSITVNTVQDYILFLKDEHECNDITINSYLRSIRAFLYWCMRNDYMSTFTVQLLKTTKNIKETYSEYELALLLTKPNPKKCSFTEYKTWAFSNFLLGTGMRISSALDVKIEDLDFENMLITMHKSKNRKAQYVPMSNSLYTVLQEYLIYRQGDVSDYLFCNLYGEKGNISSFQDNLADYNHSRGVDKTSAHLYRHTFAKNWILNGGDIFRLQKILGHSDLSVVKEYVNMFSCDLAVDFDKFNPLDNLKLHKNKAIGMKKHSD